METAMETAKGFRRQVPFGKVRTHYMAEGVADGDHHDIPDLKPM